MTASHDWQSPKTPAIFEVSGPKTCESAAASASAGCFGGLEPPRGGAVHVESRLLNEKLTWCFAEPGVP